MRPFFRPESFVTDRQFCGVEAALAVLALAYPVLAIPACLAGVAAAVWFVAPHLARRAPPRTGIMLVGHDAADGSEVLHDSSDARHHLLVVGGNESVRTDYFIDLLDNATQSGSGGMLVTQDPDGATYQKVLAACVAAGREDDLLVVDFNSRSPADPGRAPARSHTFNPFASGSGELLAHILCSVVHPGIGNGPDGAMWMGRMMAFTVGLMRVLVWKRDRDTIEMTPRTIADHAGIGSLVALTQEEGMLPETVQPLLAYLRSLPGYDAERGEHQRQTAADQHAHLQSALTGMLNGLDLAHPHILRTSAPDAAMEDVVLRRRILLFVLPNAGDKNRSAAGRLVVATLKGLMAETLGAAMEKDWDSVVSQRRFNGKKPFYVLLNGADGYFVTGMAIMAAMSRSLGTALVFGVPDTMDMIKANDREAKSVLANTTGKIYLQAPPGSSFGRMGGDRAAWRAMGEAIAAGPVPDVRLELTGYVDLEALHPGEGMLLFGDKARRIRIDRFLKPPAAYGRRFNRLIPFLAAHPGDLR